MQLEGVPKRRPLTGEEYDPLQIRRLNLSKNNLVHVACLPAFANLVSLDVSNNGLSFFPEDIGKMVHLRSLVARNNLIEELPKSMTSLENMETLYLSGNRFETVPPVLFSMHRLRVLHLGGNRIENVPYAIGTLLSRLVVDDANAVSHDPKNQSLYRLEILYLGGNLLKEVPATIGRLQRLSSLSLCDNQLETIPSTFGELRNLESLSLHNNVLKTLPTEIVKLRNLQQLSLRNNPLVHHFVHNMQLEPPKLKELAGRIVRLKMSRLPIKEVLPRELIAYLNSANQCVNPKCKGVYFEACVEHVKFVDFCGKYRVPSPKCSAATPAYVSSESSSDSDDDVPKNMKMKKILLG
ncbi:leucine Rich repeat-containing domain protein [Necator americanus]|uniref:Leucine Rich repeat-containing domain protein n=1 Tax=Necator americanus TaxID=51031 RepID=W2SJR4_NECAM|nr:leucine Rich repeat-containing domain protein [Necator americanus]ETN68997.1 leucine Rich repeat-containing domain protein [Necator americanus]